MKKVLVLMALVISSVISSAQEVHQLKEARVEGASLSPTFNYGNNSVVIKIPEKYSGEFQRNPLQFMNNYLEIKPIIAQMEYSDAYYVTFKSTKGKFKATFDGNGKFLSYSLKFDNVVIPHQLMAQLYRDYKGWTLVRTVYIAKGNGESIEDTQYKVTMKNGKEKRKLKYSYPQNSSEVAGDFVVN